MKLHVLASLACLFLAFSCRAPDAGAADESRASGATSGAVTPTPSSVVAVNVRPAPTDADAQASRSGPGAAAGSTVETAVASGAASGAQSSGPAPTADVVPLPGDAVVSVTARMPDEVRGGRPFDYTLTVANRGRDALASVVVRETLGAGLAFVAAEPAPTRVEEDGVLVFELGELAPADPRSIVVTATPAAGETVTRSSAVDVRVVRETQARVVTPGLALAVVFDSLGTLVCDDVRGRFVASNPGNGRTEDVVVQAELPAGLTTLDGRASVRVDVGTLEVGESREVPFTCRAQQPGAFSLAARAQARGDVTAEAVAASVAVHEPRVALEVVGPAGGFSAGRAGTLTFRATNATESAVDGVRLVVTAPAVLVFEGAESGGVRDGERCTWTIGTLEPGEVRELTARLRAAAPLVASVRAELTARCAEAARASHEVNVAGAVDLSVRLTDASGVALVLDPQIYECKLENQGQVALTDLRVAASWPAQVEWVDSPFAPTPFVAGERAEFNVGALGMGEERTFSFRLRARVAGTYKINALVTGAETPRPVSQDEVTTFVER